MFDLRVLPRPGTLDDAEDFARILALANPHWFPEDLAVSLVRGHPMASPDTPYRYAGLYWNDQLIGGTTSYLMGSMCVLDDLAVVPHARTKGGGLRLWMSNLAWAQGQGAKTLYLEVHRDCLEAVPWFYRRGMRGTRWRRNHFGPGGDALLMRGTLHQLLQRFP